MAAAGAAPSTGGAEGGRATGRSQEARVPNIVRRAAGGGGTAEVVGAAGWWEAHCKATGLKVVAVEVGAAEAGSSGSAGGEESEGWAEAV